MRWITLIAPIALVIRFACRVYTIRERGKRWERHMQFAQQHAAWEVEYQKQKQYEREWYARNAKESLTAKPTRDNVV